MQHNTTDLNDTSRSQSESGSLLNRNITRTTNSGDSRTLTTIIQYSKNFPLTGRNLNIGFSGAIRNASAESHLLSLYQVAAQPDTGSTRQTRQIEDKQYQYTTVAGYTEPLSKKISLLLNASLNYQNNNNRNIAFDFNRDEGRILNPAFSSHYRYRSLQLGAGGDIQLSIQRGILTIGAGWTRLMINQEDDLKGNRLESGVNSLSPRLYFQLPVSNRETLSFSYSGTNMPPAAGQLNPLNNNSNPLETVRGNPGLKQAFSHSLACGISGWSEKK